MIENFDNLFPVFEEDESYQLQEPEVEEEIITTQEDELEEPIVQEPQETDEVATLFYKELIEKNIASPVEGKEEYTWEDIDSAINLYREELPKAVASALVQSASPVAQKLIDFVFTKGEELTQDELVDFFSKYNNSTSINDFNELTPAREYLNSKYKEQGFRQSQIDAMLDALEDEEDEGKALINEANKFVAKDKQVADQILEQEKQNRETKLNEAKEANKVLFSKTLQEIDSTDWKKDRKEKIKQQLVSNAFGETFNEAFKSPKALMQLANLSTYFNKNTGEFDFSDFIKQLNSKPASSLKDQIQKDMFSSSANRTSKGGASNPNTKSLLDSLVPISPLEE